MGNTIEYKCPNCKAPLEYNSNSEKIECEYCGSSFNISEIRSYSEELQKSKADETFWNSEKSLEYTDDELKNLNVYHCSGCNGEVVADENTSATKCPYCGSPVLLKGRLSGVLKPDYIIPFKKDDKAAKDSFNAYLKNKILLPKVFRSENTISEIKGIYIPYWVYDSTADGTVNFIGEKHRCYREGDYEVDETLYFAITRTGSVSFRKVPQDASKNTNDALMESIEPFNFSEAVKFDTPYLSGYFSDKYDVTKEEAFTRVRKRVIDGTINEFKNTIGAYSMVRVTDYNLALKDVKAMYCLYPVWLLNIKWEDKIYNFAMNGETGKIKGDLPVSKIKYSLSFVVFFILGGLLGALLAYLSDGYVSDNMIIVGIIVGIITSIVCSYLLKRQMKAVRLKVGASDYCDRSSLNIRHRNERFLRRAVSRRRINNDNDNNRPRH